MGMNQYFEWQVKLAGGKSSGGGHRGSPQIDSPHVDMDIGAMVPIERV